MLDYDHKTSKYAAYDVSYVHINRVLSAIYSFILFWRSRYFGQPLDWPDHFEDLAVGVGDDIKTGL